MSKPIASEADDLRAATREAHEMMRDLNALMKRGEDLAMRIETMIATDVGDRINLAVGLGLENYSVAIKQATESATQEVFKRFDTILEYLMGTAKAQRRRSEYPPITDMLEAAQAMGVGDPKVDLSFLRRSIAEDAVVGGSMLPPKP